MEISKDLKQDEQPNYDAMQFDENDDHLLEDVSKKLTITTISSKTIDQMPDPQNK